MRDCHDGVAVAGLISKQKVVGDVSDWIGPYRKEWEEVEKRRLRRSSICMITFSREKLKKLMRPQTILHHSSKNLEKRKY